jgi:flagellar basal-body rod protein FlgC
MSLFSSLQVSASGMSAQRTRAEMLVENMANTETTRTPEGGPYRRKDVVFASQVQASPFSATFQNEMSEGVPAIPMPTPTATSPSPT